MNLRWLFGNFADPQYGLDPRRQRDLSNRAHEGHMPRTVFLLWTIGALVLPFALIFKFVLPAVLAWFGFEGQTMPFLIGAAIVLLLFWVWAAWVYNFIYARPVRRAMRERGYDVCVSCGYRLEGLDDDISRCPECGAPHGCPRGDPKQARS